METKLTPIEKRIIEKFANGDVKPIKKSMRGVRHPITKKTLEFTTINLTPQKQSIANRLANKGYLELPKGKIYLHELIVSKKFKEIEN